MGIYPQFSWRSPPGSAGLRMTISTTRMAAPQQRQTKVGIWRDVGFIADRFGRRRIEQAAHLGQILPRPALASRP
jgi:hypothetical protein